MAQLKWTFANNNGGRETGFHEAGVETFKGNIDRYLARELIQNSLDAPRDPHKPVRVEFELITLRRAQVPDMDGLGVALTRCSEYWQSNARACAYFAEAAQLARKERITALRVGDYNTTGVRGSDVERSNNWYNLIRSAGSSSKGGGEGGSFGIGKNAPFAASQMRTVLYSTRNVDDEFIFQGVATLASHSHPEGGVAQATGFLGGDRGSSVRARGSIPPQLLRNDYGTDIVILGFPATEKWADELVYSVLDNFWPAIHFSELEVRVAETSITRDTLPGLLEQFSASEGFTAHRFYRAFTQPTHERSETLRQLGKVSLYLLSGEADFPKRVAMVRRTGMKIFEKRFQCFIPFCGVFICRNDQGNKLLRDMEPPRHDVWDADHPDKGVNKKIENEYLSFIRSCLRQLTPADDVKVLSIPGLQRFLPDDEDTPDAAFESDGGAEDESIHRRQLPERIEGRRITPLRGSMQRDQRRPGSGSSETHVDDNGDAFGDTSNEGEAGARRARRPEAEQLGVGASTHGGGGSRPAIAVSYRTFVRDAVAGVYALNIEARHAAEIDATLHVWTVGDDQRTQAPIVAARLLSGEPVPVKNGAIGPVTLTPSRTMKLEIILREPMRAAMEVSAHEA